MQTIISKEEKRRRTNERRSVQRREQGAIPRAEYRQTAAGKAATAKSLKALGKSLRAIAAELDMPLSTVQYYCAQ